MADIAKAYVQIIPTTKDIAQNLKDAINGEDMTKVGDSVGSNLAGGIKNALLKAGIGVAIGKTIADAIKNGADFEQLYGGAEKIFAGMDTSQIVKDATDAYKTMGMSANEYLKVINDVGAGFKASMGSAAGYETAKKGLQAISDYASGTGKDINLLSQKFTMITRSTSSYQSIADQFSGILPATSKAFLEQAQAAGDLSDSYTSLTQVPIAEYQQAVANALERGVDALNLTGNTAKEASSTLSGSIQQMKSAWDNFKTSLTVPEIDASEAFSRLIDSVGDVIDNIVPMFEEMGPEIANALGRALTELGPKLLNILGRTLREIITSIPQMFSKLDFGGIVMSIGAIGAAFVKIVPSIQAAIKAMSAFNAACMANPYAIAIVGAIALGAAIGILAGEMFTSSEVGQEFVNRVARMQVAAEQAGHPISTLGASFKVAGQMIKESLDGIDQKARELGNKISGAVDGAFDAVKSKLGNLFEPLARELEKAAQKVTEWGDDLKSRASNAIQEMADGVINALKDLPKKIKQVGQQMAMGLYNGFMDRWNSIYNDIVKGVTKLVDGLKDLLGIHSPSRVFADEIGAMMAEGLSVGFSAQMPKVNAEISSDIRGTLAETNSELTRALRSTPNMSASNRSDSNAEIINALKNITVQSNVVLEGDAGKLFKSVQSQNRTYRNMTGRSAFA